MFNAELLSAKKTRNLTNAGMMAAALVFAMLLFSVSVVEPLTKNDFLYYQDRSGLHMSDYVLFFVSGKMVLGGSGLDAYAPAVQMRYVDELIYPSKMEKDFFLQYPPITFAFMVPFALLPLNFSYFLWVLLLTVSAGGALISYLVRCKGWSPVMAVTCTAYLFCAYPAVFAWKHGQPAWFVLAFYLFYLLAAHHQRHRFQGLSIAACTFKPQYGIILGLHALCTRRWRAVCWAALGVAVMVVVSIAAVGWDNVVNYPHILHDAEKNGAYAGVFPEFMISVRALLCRYLTPMQALNASSALWMLIALIDCLLFVGAQRRSLACRQWAFAVAVCAGLVFSPHAHVHDTLLLAAAFAVTRAQGDAQVPSGSARILDRLWLALLMLYVPLSWPLHVPAAIDRFQKIPFLIYDCLLLAVSAAMLFVQWRQRDAKCDADSNLAAGTQSH
jgi:hypothetical protein